MILQLPEDGLTVLSTILSFRVLLPLLAAYGLILWKSSRESHSPFSHFRSSPPGWLLLSIGLSWLLGEILLTVLSDNWTRSTVLLRDGFVIVAGVMLPALIVSNPDRPLLPWSGRFRPWGRLLNLGIVAFLALGLFFWSVTYLAPFALRLRSVPEFSLTTVSDLINTVLLLPLMEEYLFRALIYPIFRSFFTLWGGVPLVSLLFAGLHGLGSIFWFRFGGSLVISILFEATGSILPGLVVHSGFNFLVSYGGLLLG